MLPVGSGDLAGNERWELVSRVAASRHFARAAQLRELLLYLGERAINSPATPPSEKEIGTGALGRKPDYDPQVDNIVRVQIRRLRQKLEEYFASEGAEEQMLLQIPKGAHALQFEPKNVAEPPAEPPAAPPPPPASRWPRIGAAVVALAALICVVVWAATKRAGASPAGLAANPVWASLLAKGQQTTVIIADSSLEIVEDALGLEIALDEYVKRTYKDRLETLPQSNWKSMLREISDRHYTSTAGAMLASKLQMAGAGMGATVSIRSARQVDMRDFQAGNLILVGNKRVSPWFELFEPDLNFIYERIGSGANWGFRNLRPARGEREVYPAARWNHGAKPAAACPVTPPPPEADVALNPDGPRRTFASISMLPNPGHNGIVLLLNGATMEAAEAAGEFSMSDEFVRLLNSAIGTRAGGRPPYFEVLIKVAVVAGAPHKINILGWRKPAADRQIAPPAS